MKNTLINNCKHAALGGIDQKTQRIIQNTTHKLYADDGYLGRNESLER